jgi:hypothetical protein
MAVKAAGFFSGKDVADALIAKGLAAEFVSAVEARDRRKVIVLLTKVTQDKSGQTADALADLYLTGQTSLAPLKACPPHYSSFPPLWREPLVQLTVRCLGALARHPPAPATDKGVPATRAGMTG